MKKLIFIFAFLFLILLSYSSAQTINEIPVFPQSEPLIISKAIRDGAVSPNADIKASLTLKDPRNYPIFVGNMSYNSNIQQHNITIPSQNLSALGIYTYEITANNGTTSNTESFSFEITLSGQRASTSQSLVFAFMSFIALIIFCISLYGAIKIPFKNSKDQRGRIISINDLKYLKIFLWFITYLLAIFITFSLSSVARISNWDVSYRWFSLMFWALLVLLFPTFVIMLTTSVINFFNDKKNLQLIERNLKPR